jgi:hypothetical protein
MEFLKRRNTAETTECEFTRRDVSSEQTTLAVIRRERASSKKDDGRSVRLESVRERSKGPCFCSDHASCHRVVHGRDARLITCVTKSLSRARPHCEPRS